MALVFPDPNLAHDDGLVAIGPSLSLENLIEAYCRGIFPWPINDEFSLTWFSPNPRGILDFNDYRESSSFKKFVRSTDYYCLVNTDFDLIIKNCSTVKRQNDNKSWINSEIIKAYKILFSKKLAYSIGTYQNGTLIGGLYGVCIGEIISGESMFFNQSNASKFALRHLVQILQKNGIKWIDTQMVTPLIQSFGGKEIPRDIFLKKITQLDLEKDYDQVWKT